MNSMTLNEWIEKLRSRFSERERKYMTACKATIRLQLKDRETGEIHIHQLNYQNADSENIAMITTKKGGKNNE